MNKPNTIEEYIEIHPKYAERLNELRQILINTELEENIKWNAPVYSLDGKNVIGLGAFKNHIGLWFFNGIFLNDEKNVLVNAQDGKTKALRQMRFEDHEEIDAHIVSSYVKEAIENQRNGKVIAPKKTKKSEIEIPAELTSSFLANDELKKSFDFLSAYKQKEYAEYISRAKREETRQSRMLKIVPMILQGIGLNDKYK
ncbi:Uncharacterized conserved protein YdeI, YjbR/CyaY-like superfamily, DUF1801 family [Flavobacteriaceae bacterium MAR_2010_188]|nr:Uncharacterized conserved protein YdeI, YjbR/CyaY-like superfamily, DUF1801 family [Flavobacteriaceae bacterium MAR_2010_188]